MNTIDRIRQAIGKHDRYTFVDTDNYNAMLREFARLCEIERSIQDQTQEEHY